MFRLHTETGPKIVPCLDDPEDEDGSTELDEAEKQGENDRHISLYRIIAPTDVRIAQEIAALRKEALAYKAVRNALRSPQTTDDAAKTVFEKVRFVSRDATRATKFMACIRSSMRI
ncbi:hypothetical protein JVT61DRAFT_9500 [Boletus reticuloceps]|uniref:Uncharacterized protein n=1 Tax=Boletus reticuloceps TaxID=495285 RepID=A0A8I2YGC9_9AGAM|nr:hypothetical protein JVT61DRAFT_9500 [Boletus reticuloceps]